MTKTEAADILANKVLALLKTEGACREPDKDIVEAVLSEAKHWPGLFPAAAASGVTWRTVLRLARQYHR